MEHQRRANGRPIPEEVLKKQKRDRAMRLTFVVLVVAVTIGVFSVISAAVGFVVALIAAYKEKSLLTVALFACAAVFIVERILEFAM